MAVMIKIVLWIILVLCVVGFVWDAYDIVFKDRGSGWRAADLLSMFMAMFVAAKVVSWLL